VIATLALCATAFVWTADANVQPKPEGLDLHPIEQSLLDCTNAERAKAGLPTVELDPELMQSARQHATWMTQNQRLIHTSRPVAENIAMGQTTSEEALRSWMNSPGHRANILNRGHRRIGVAAYRTAAGVVYWCQQFGK
jgi:uncharacterized protein YkwD